MQNQKTEQNAQKAPKKQPWGDSEHDTMLHSKQEPHTAPSEYDAKYHRYRTNGG